MKVAAAVAEILKREGVEFLIGYPVNPIIEAAAAGRHPDDHRPPGADRDPHGRRGQPRHLRRTDRGLRDAARPRDGERVRRRRPGLRRLGADRRHPGGYPRTMINAPPNFNAFLNYQHVTKSAEQVIMADAVPDAMRRAFTQVGTVGRGRCWSRSRRTSRRGGAEAARLPCRRACARGPTRWRWPRSRARWWRPSGRSSTPGQGVHYAEAWPQLRGAGRAAGGAGHDQPPGEERVPREPSARSGSGGRSIPKPVHHFLTSGRRHLRHRLQLRRDELRRDDAAGQDHHPRHARPGRPQQGHRATSRSSATPA